MIEVGAFDTKVLQAMWQFGGGSESFSAFDDDLMRTGRQLFGPGWGGKVCNYQDSKPADSIYCPTITLSLGRLTKLGLVQKVGSFGSGKVRYHSWNLTEAGSDWCKSAFRTLSLVNI